MIFATLILLLKVPLSFTHSFPPPSVLVRLLLPLLRQRRRVVEQVPLVAELLKQIGSLDRRVALELRESLELVAGAADGAAERGVGGQGVVGASGDLIEFGFELREFSYD